MLVKELNVKHTLHTKAKKLLELSTKDFFIQLGTIRQSTTYTEEYISEVNYLLEVFAEEGFVELDYNHRTTSDVPHFISIIEDSNIIIPTTRENLLRRGKKMSIIDRGIAIPTSEVITTSQTPFDTYVALKYLSKLQSATERGIEFKLTLRDMEKLLKTKKCYYSGVTLELEGDLGLSIDRIDSKVGYVADNCVACSYITNSIKNELLDNGVNIDILGKHGFKKMLLKFSELVK